MVEIVNTDTEQNDSCYSIDKRNKSVQFKCKSANEFRNDCITKLFEANGPFAKNESNSEVGQLKISGCSNKIIIFLYEKFKNVNSLDISNIGLNSLDVAAYNFYYHHYLSTLNMSYNEMSTFHMDLPSALEVLDISNNRIETISSPDLIINDRLKKLTILNLKNNLISIDCDFLPILLSSITTHYTLDVINKIDFRCRGFGNISITMDIGDEVVCKIVGNKRGMSLDKKWFKKLRAFKFEDNGRVNTERKTWANKDKTAALINLFGPSLEHLELAGVEIGEINGMKFQEFDQLKNLLLTNTGLNSFTLSDIKNIAKLESLDISGNNLKQIGNVTLISRATNLKKLCVQENQIANVAELIKYLGPSMEYLDLSNNFFGGKAMQNILKNQMINLKVLKLKRVNLPSFDFDTIGHLAGSLVVLYISENDLSKIDSIEMLKNFEYLSKLYVNDNKLANIVEFLRNLPPALIDLDIAGNYVGEITSDMFLTSTKLNFLNLSRTNLINFSIQIIEKLTSLRSLDISGNNLKRVDFRFSSKEKSRLSNLYLNMNNLTELDTLSPIEFSALFLLQIEKNRFACKYLDGFESKWNKTRKYTRIYRDGCLVKTVEIGNDHVFLSVVISTFVFVAVAVTAITGFLVYRLMRSNENKVQEKLMYNKTEPVIENNTNYDPNDHIYEEIEGIPGPYDQLRFVNSPMPLSKHTLNHYDNASVLRR